MHIIDRYHAGERPGPGVAAHRLASAHGHDWAGRVVEAACRGDRWSCLGEAIAVHRQACEASRAQSVADVDAVGLGPSLTHETGRRALAWDMSQAVYRIDVRGRYDVVQGDRVIARDVDRRVARRVMRRAR